jgi:hypothetical protein
MRYPGFQPEPDPRPGRRIALVVVLGLVAIIAGANLWTAIAVDFSPAPPAPEVENDLPLPDPNVLHQSVIALPHAIVAVPYQAGDYELARVVPTELTLFYRHTRGTKQARVMLFGRPLWRRMAPLANFAAGVVLDQGLTPATLSRAIQTTTPPSWGDRLLPWRVIGHGLRRAARDLVMAEGDGGVFKRLWRGRFGDADAVGREYTLPRRTGSRVAVTVFKGGKIHELLFAFDFDAPANHALVRAWIEAIEPAGLTRPDNAEGFADCDTLPEAGPNREAVRTCQKIFATAMWVGNRYDAHVADNLVDVLKQDGDVVGLEIIARQLALLKAEDAGARRLLGRVEISISRLKLRELKETENAEIEIQPSEQEQEK